MRRPQRFERATNQTAGWGPRSAQGEACLAPTNDRRPARLCRGDACVARNGSSGQPIKLPVGVPGQARARHASPLQMTDDRCVCVGATHASPAAVRKGNQSNCRSASTVTQGEACLAPTNDRRPARLCRGRRMRLPQRSERGTSQIAGLRPRSPKARHASPLQTFYRPLFSGFSGSSAHRSGFVTMYSRIRSKDSSLRMTCS